NISNNLPFGQYLYVKDHRSAIGLNSDEFYRKISALPAVRLIPAEYNIKDLIKYSAGVITVNSTAGYEALILGKPVYLLGNVFYQNFSNVIRLENFDSLRSYLGKPTEFIENAADIVAYRRITYEGLLNFNIVDYEDNKYFFDQLALN
ncbi:capsular biosynthesis protein, partial [Pseudomonas aeruginosa]